MKGKRGNKALDKKSIPEITGISCDSRQIRPGNAFVAITGFNHDGNNFIEEAVINGARVIITEKKSSRDYGVPIIMVEDSRAALGELAADYYGHPSKRLKLIGVTGTNGKTTTTHLIYRLLNEETRQAGLVGTVNIDTGDRLEPGELTTPPAVNLQAYLGKMVNNGLKYACMEVSSHGIKLKRISGTRFSVKVGTNISLDHFDLHPEFPDYIEVKRSFLSSDKDCLVIVNQDDYYLGRGRKLAGKQLNYALKTDAEITAREIRERNFGLNFTYLLKKPLQTDSGRVIGPLKLPLQTNLPGRHNIYNTLVAVTVALYYDLHPGLIQAFFRRFPGVWRRFQLIYRGKYAVIDDCAHNPGSYQAVFQAARNLSYEKILIVNSLRGNRGIRINRENAVAIGKWLPLLGSYRLITTNCNDVVKPVDLVSPEEERVFLDSLRKNRLSFTHFDELRPALEATLDEVSTGDLILLLGPHAMDRAGEMFLELLK